MQMGRFNEKSSNELVRFPDSPIPSMALYTLTPENLSFFK